MPVPPGPGGRAGEGPLTEIIVIPRSTEIEEAEKELSRALVALIGGMRPEVTTVMVRRHLRDHYGLLEESITVCCHVPEDFLMTFTSRHDCDMVLHSVPP